MDREVKEAALKVVFGNRQMIKENTDRDYPKTMTWMADKGKISIVYVIPEDKWTINGEEVPEDEIRKRGWMSCIWQKNDRVDDLKKHGHLKYSVEDVARMIRSIDLHSEYSDDYSVTKRAQAHIGWTRSAFKQLSPEDQAKLKEMVASDKLDKEQAAEAGILV